MRLNSKFSFILVFLLVTFYSLLITREALALTVSPVRLELSGDPGDTVFGNFKLFNEKDEPLKYYIIFRTFSAKDETGEPNFPEEQDEFISWVNVSPEVTVPAKDYKELTFKVNIPKDADPSAHFAAIFASTIPPKNEDNSSTLKITGEVGTLILFRVNGDFKAGADILEFDTKERKNSYTELPVWFYYRFQNSGDNYIKPLGDIIIKNFFGGTTKVIPANRDKGNILPGSVRKFESAWWEAGGVKNQSPDFKPYGEPQTFWEHVSHQWNNFAFGKYTATLNLAYEKSSDKTATATTSFWMIPWHLLSVIIVVGTIFFGGIILIAITIALLFIKASGRSPKKKKPSKSPRKKPTPKIEETEPEDI